MAEAMLLYLPTVPDNLHRNANRGLAGGAFNEAKKRICSHLFLLQC